MAAREQSSDWLLVSEYFPPAVGGSAELFANVYGRLRSPGAVLTTSDRHVAASEASALPVFRTGFPQGLGLAAPSSLRKVVELSSAISKRCSAGTVVHCGRALPEGTAAWLGRFISKRPYLCWTHGEELPIAAGSRELTWLLRRVHRGASALVANSHNTARMLAALGNAPDKIHVVHPGVDADRFRPDVAGAPEFRQSVVAADELLLLSVGRLQARKGHDLVLKAIAWLGPRATRIRYLVAGTGPEGPRLERLTAELGIGDRVTFMGKVAAEALPACYAAADIFVHPNRVEDEDFEGFGIVFLEAAAAGVPAVGGRSGGVSEAISEGVTGLLVSGTDVEELGRVILRLAESAALRERLGQAARSRVLRDFGWLRAASALGEIDAYVREST